MARPKKGTKEGNLASAKWRKTMVEKYGEDGFRKKMQENGKKGGSRSTPTGGFGADHERARIAGAKGGSISKRNEAKNWYENNKDEIESMRQDGFTIKQIGSILGCSQQKIYYVLNRYGEQ